MPNPIQNMNNKKYTKTKYLQYLFKNGNEFDSWSNIFVAFDDDEDFCIRFVPFFVSISHNSIDSSFLPIIIQDGLVYLMYKISVQPLGYRNVESRPYLKTDNFYVNNNKSTHLRSAVFNFSITYVCFFSMKNKNPNMFPVIIPVKQPT